MKTVAVVIKHPYRESDYRVDLYEVPETTTNQEVREMAYLNMLGPFEIVCVTDKISKI